MATVRPSEIKIPVGYPNDDPFNGAGMGQGDYDDGQIGGDSLRTIAELITMDTFEFLEPEFQRSFIAMAVAARIEANLIHGVGTGWRSEATQQANWERNPKQFAPVSASLHMRKKPFNVAYAIDTVPGDTWKWMHANCARFFINALDNILHEQHHIQPIWFPDSGSAYNKRAAELSAKARVRQNLPYLGTLTLAEWLDRDDPITLWPQQPAPTPTPVPTPEPPAPIPFTVSRELVMGATGDDVRCLQQSLVSHGQPAVVVDGSFGAQTDTAVRNYQHAAGLAVDGRAGASTLTSLGIWGGAPPATPPPPPVYPDPNTIATPPGTPSMKDGSTDANTVVAGWSGGRVTALQLIIAVPPTGTYDASTVAKIRELQTVGALTADGVYGPKTAEVFMVWRGK